METKFTKGEWTFYETPNYHKPECSRIEVSSRDSSLLICKVQNSGYIAEDEGLANAKLIAAAPELLEALISVLNIMNDSDGVAGYHLNGDIASWGEFEEIKQAEQAIKKATE